MPNLSVTTNSDFYLNCTEGNGLNIPKILARIIQMRAEEPRAAPTLDPEYVERSGEKCPEIIVNRLKTMKRVSNTNKFTSPLYQGWNIIDTQC